MCQRAMSNCSEKFSHNNPVCGRVGFTNETQGAQRAYPEKFVVGG